jgi:hypothetical protein
MASTDTTKTYRGLLVPTSNGEADDLVGLIPEGSDGEVSILAELVADDFPETQAWHSRRAVARSAQVSVRYFVTDEPVPPDELESELASMATGDADIRYGMVYSEETGYLWTNEDLVVGGHDVIEELLPRLGKWLHLEVTFHGPVRR